MTEFDLVLDECIDSMRRGHSVEQCLALHPEHAAQLEPLLRAAEATRTAYSFQPSETAMRRARAHLEKALLESSDRRRESTLRSVFGGLLRPRPMPVAAIASLAVIALTALLLVWPTLTSPTGLSPDTPPTTEPPAGNGERLPPVDPGDGPGVPDPPEPSDQAMTVVAAHEDGNFIFYLSDEPNHIGDFETLAVTISTVMLKPQEDDPWITFDVTQQSADLVQLQGDRSLELWRGNVPEGTYTNVFLYIEHVEGILAATGEAITLGLPSSRLHLNLTFDVVSGALTEFVFDITVRRAGPPGTTNYLLLPQVSASGTGRNIERVELPHYLTHEAQGQPDNTQEPQDRPSENRRRTEPPGNPVTDHVIAGTGLTSAIIPRFSWHLPS